MPEEMTVHSFLFPKFFPFMPVVPQHVAKFSEWNNSYSSIRERRGREMDFFDHRETFAVFGEVGGRFFVGGGSNDI